MAITLKGKLDSKKQVDDKKTDLQRTAAERKTKIQNLVKSYKKTV